MASDLNEILNDWMVDPETFVPDVLGQIQHLTNAKDELDQLKKDQRQFERYRMWERCRARLAEDLIDPRLHEKLPNPRVQVSIVHEPDSRAIVWYTHLVLDDYEEDAATGHLFYWSQCQASRVALRNLESGHLWLEYRDEFRSRDFAEKLGLPVYLAYDKKAHLLCSLNDFKNREGTFLSTVEV